MKKLSFKKKALPKKVLNLGMGFVCDLVLEICDFPLECLRHNNLSLEPQVFLHREVAFKQLIMQYILL